MTVANTNRTNKTQVCMHNVYGRLERAPGAQKFRVVADSKRQLPATGYQRVLPGAIPCELIDTGVKNICEQRCSECLRMYPYSEFVGTLCRGCYCGCGTLDEELAGLRSKYSVSDKWSREMSFFNEIYCVGGGGE